WNCELPGRIWLEPAGWGRSLLQVFHTNWENLPGPLQLSERRLIAGFWADAVQRAAGVCNRPAATATAPHTWGAGPAPAAPAGPPGAAAATPEFFMQMKRTGEFLGRVMQDTTGALIGMLCLLGDRLGLFQDLAANGAATAEQLALRKEIHPRYAR